MKQLKVLIVEDSEKDAALLLRELLKAGYKPVWKRVDTEPDLKSALDTESWDIIISDHSMPGFTSLDALKIVRYKNLDLPFIIVSGQIGEDVAVQAMKAGAHDYLMKGNLKRLGPAIERELEEAAARLQFRMAGEALEVKEEELRLSRKMEALKDEFIGMVSHEIKTPLTIIIGALNVANTDGISPEQAKEFINDAAASAQDLSTMVDNLLELSRFQANRLSLQTKPTQIEPIVRAVERNLRGQLVIHQLSIELPSALPPAMIDSIRVERVLYNLVENAIKYSPKGGKVTITGRPQDIGLVIGVSDEGIGIPVEDQPRLFQRFERLEVQKKYDISGVGLGLRVCQILVEAHGGRIWVESEPDKGSTFFFSLPVAKKGTPGKE